MNKKIMTIAGILFALVFIVVMAGILSGVLKFGEITNKGISNLSEAVITAELEIYNGATISGDQVAAAINKLKETKSGLKMSYAVRNTSTWRYYGYKLFTMSGTNTVTMGMASSTYTVYKTNTDMTSDEFISPTKEYKAEIVFNANNIVVGIYFIRV